MNQQVVNPAPSLPVSTYAVLGLVDKQPGASGYDLVTVADESFAYFWPISQTLLYRELGRLAELGWVTASRVEQTKSPSKSVYEISPTGQDALARWLSEPADLASSYRSEFLLRFFFAYRMSGTDLTTLLAALRRSLTAQADRLRAVTDKLAEFADGPHPPPVTSRLSALYGLRTLEAQLAWVDEVEAELRTGQED